MFICCSHRWSGAPRCGIRGAASLNFVLPVGALIADVDHRVATIALPRAFLRQTGDPKPPRHRPGFSAGQAREPGTRVSAVGHGISFVSHRLARLAMKGAADALLAAAFGAALGGGVLETVAHTACSYLTN